MAFRTLEISNEAEIHIKDGQLEVTNKKRYSIDTYRRFVNYYGSWSKYTFINNGHIYSFTEQSGNCNAR